MAQSEFRIGIVGIGRMGANMARRLHDLHYAIVAVYDTNTERAEALAKELGLSFLDSGAMYRAVTLVVLEHDVDPMDGERCAEKIMERLSAK